VAKAKARETTSLATTKDQVKKLLSKYIDLSFYSPEPKQRIPNAVQELLNHNNWPGNLISLIKNVLGTPCNMPLAPEFSFELSNEAAMHNLTVLRKYQFNLGQIKTHLLDQENSLSLQRFFTKCWAFIRYGRKWKPSSCMEVFGH
jgi:hypothetical protein